MAEKFEVKKGYIRKKVDEYIQSNRALQMWQKLNEDEEMILIDFASWMDENSVCYNGNHQSNNGVCIVDGGLKPE